MLELYYANDPCNGIFESMRAYGGRIFMLDEHIDRLCESCNSLGLKMPVDKNGLKRRISSVLRKSNLKEAYVRVAVNGGINIIIKKFRPYPAEFYGKGVKAICVPTRKNFCNSLNGRIKSQNFLNGIMARLESMDAFEAILPNEAGYVAEGTTSNLFAVKEGAIYSPPAYLGILDGITRRSVIAIARRIGLEAMEIPLTRYDLYNADEAFLTNTSIEIMPLVNVDGRMINEGLPGEITKRLLREFRKERRKRW